MAPPVSFGSLIKERRQAEGQSQDELAARIGISRVYLSQIERGVAPNVSPEVERRLRTALGIADGGDAASQPDEGLRRLADELRLPDDDVAMLARIEHRGRRPQSYEEWKALYLVIAGLLGPSESR